MSTCTRNAKRFFFPGVSSNSYSMVVVVLGIFSNLLSVYLAYILYKVNDICVVCVITYVVNAAIMFFAIKKMRKLSADNVPKKKKK